MTSKNSISNKIKMKIDNNIFIKSLYFSEYGYGYPEEVYEYKKGKICFTSYAGGISPLINVRDNAKFSKCIFEIIENWKHKYYWKDFTICDGILWMLRIRLSNGKYLKYEGHQMFPDNYTKLRGYLNRYVGKYVNKFEEEYRKYGYLL